MHGKFTPNTKHLQSEQKFSVCTLNPHGLEINPFFVVAKLIQITMFVVCIAFFLKTNLGGTLTANCTWVKKKLRTKWLHTSRGANRKQRTLGECVFFRGISDNVHNSWIFPSMHHLKFSPDKTIERVWKTKNNRIVLFIPGQDKSTAQRCDHCRASRLRQINYN